MITASPPGSSGSPMSNTEVLKGGEEGLKVAVESKENQKEGNTNWAGIAKDKRSLKKYDVEIKSIEGKSKVVAPDGIFSDATPLWEDFVVGRFLDIAPHIAKVHMVVNKIWSYGDPSSKVEVFDVNATMMRFKIKNQKAREKVIKRGMWNIAGIPMIVKKWMPKTEEEKQEEEAIPMWVHLRKVPLHMFSWEALSFMTSAVGHPVHLHPETLACSNFEEAKIFVNVDVSKTLPKEIEFVIEGKEFIAEFYYPWLPSRCQSCEKWGHTEKVCVVKKSGRKQGGGTGEVVGTTPRKVEEGHKDETLFVENHITNVGSGEKRRGESIIKEDKVVQGSGSAMENVWSIPDKVGRASSKTPDRVDVAVISASKYSVLSVEDVEEGEVQKEVQVEMEVGNNVDEEEQDGREDDYIEDEILDKKSKENEKSGSGKGGKKAQKPKAQGANLKGKRSSRRKI